MQEESVVTKGSYLQHFAKVIMLGDYGVGKTSLLQLINHEVQRGSSSQMQES
jgi:GTPase SAR1 family protein